VGRLNDITQRHNAFVQNMNIHIAASIELVSPQLVNMNKAQMLDSKDSKGKSLIHKDTGSKNLSLYYSIKTNKQTPNLFLEGTFQNEMFLDVNENNLTYFVDSLDFKSGILTDNYGLDIFGIPRKRNAEAKRLTGKAFATRYKRLVLQK